MNSPTIASISGVVLITFFFAFAAAARDHTALNGTWTLVPTKSDFAGQSVIQTGTVTIDEKEGVTIVSRAFRYTGTTETFFYSDERASENNGTARSGKDPKSKTTWDHDVLKVTTTRSGAITHESYSLAADGTMLVRVERSERAPITLVFERR